MAEIIEGTAFEKSPGWLFLNACDNSSTSLVLCQSNVLDYCEV
jgi:hypothetical protein